MDLIHFQAWWSPILVFLGAIFLSSLLLMVTYHVISPQLKKRGYTALSVVLKVIYRPLQTILWLLGLTIMGCLYLEHFFEFDVIFVMKIAVKIAAISILWVAYSLGREIERVLKERQQYDATTIELTSKISFIGLVFLTLLIIMPIFGVQITGLLAFGGFGGIIAGLAAKDILASIFGGIIMAFDKPFKIGDWICTIDGKIEGIVEHIGWRMTTIRQFDKRVLYVPNQSFSNLIFSNGSKMTHRRLEKAIRIRFCDPKKLEKILKGLREMIDARSDVDQKQDHYVNFVDFGESGFEVKITLYTKSTNYSKFLTSTEEILTAAYELIEKEGAQLAFPTTTINFSDSKDVLAEIAKSSE